MGAAGPTTRSRTKPATPPAGRGRRRPWRMVPSSAPGGGHRVVQPGEVGCAGRSLLFARRRADQVPHARDVLRILGEPPAVAGAGLGAHEGERSAASLGHVLDVEPAAVDGLVQMGAQVLAQRKPRDPGGGILAEVPKSPAVLASAPCVGVDGPVTRLLRRSRAARQEEVRRVAPQ